MKCEWLGLAPWGGKNGRGKGGRGGFARGLLGCLVGMR